MTELDPAIENILQQRYYQEGEDWEALCHRVANDLGETKKQKDEFFNRFSIGTCSELANTDECWNRSRQLLCLLCAAND